MEHMNAISIDVVNVAIDFLNLKRQNPVEWSLCIFYSIRRKDLDHFSVDEHTIAVFGSYFLVAVFFSVRVEL